MLRERHVIMFYTDRTYVILWPYSILIMFLVLTDDSVHGGRVTILTKVGQVIELQPEYLLSCMHLFASYVDESLHVPCKMCLTACVRVCHQRNTMGVDLSFYPGSSSVPRNPETVLYRPVPLVCLCLPLPILCSIYY
jgi:hypothetical protein